jgi:hypothetical protein
MGHSNILYKRRDYTLDSKYGTCTWDPDHEVTAFLCAQSVLVLVFPPLDAPPHALRRIINGTEEGHKSERAAQFVTASTCPARSPSHLAQDLLGLCPKRKEVDQYTFIESRGAKGMRAGEKEKGMRAGEKVRRKGAKNAPCPDSRDPHR